MLSSLLTLRKIPCIWLTSWLNPLGQRMEGDLESLHHTQHLKVHTIVFREKTQTQLHKIVFLFAFARMSTYLT